MCRAYRGAPDEGGQPRIAGRISPRVRSLIFSPCQMTLSHEGSLSQTKFRTTVVVLEFP